MYLVCLLSPRHTVSLSTFRIFHHLLLHLISVFFAYSKDFSSSQVESIASALGPWS